MNHQIWDAQKMKSWVIATRINVKVGDSLTKSILIALLVIKSIRIFVEFTHGRLHWCIRSIKASTARDPGWLLKWLREWLRHRTRPMLCRDLALLRHFRWRRRIRCGCSKARCGIYDLIKSFNVCTFWFAILIWARVNRWLVSNPWLLETRGVRL